MKKDIKEQVIDYLKKTSKHVFNTSEDKNNPDLIIVFNKNDKWYFLQSIKRKIKEEYETKYILRVIDIDDIIKFYGNNSKNVISDVWKSNARFPYIYRHKNKITCVKQNKFIKKMVSDMLEKNPV